MRANSSRGAAPVVYHLVLLGIVTAASLFMQSSAGALQLSFEQIDWGDGLGGYNAQNSDWGRANLLFEPWDNIDLPPDGSGGFYGFVNIVTLVPAVGTPNWAVQNVPFTFASAADLADRLPDGLTFDLGVDTGSFVPELGYALSIDAAPVPLIPSYSEFYAFAFDPSVFVLDAVEVFGGLDDSLSNPAFTGGSEQAAPPEAQNMVGAGVGQLIGAAARIVGKETDVPAIDEDVNGCAPASAARSLHYMKQFHPTLSDALGSLTPQETYDELLWMMDTQTGERARGTRYADFESGKDPFDEIMLGGGVVQTHQTGNSSSDFDDAKNAIANLGDVEVMIYYGKNGAGQSLGGHAAFVSQITKITDAAGNVTGYKVDIIDDRPQGDGIASNKKTTLIVTAAGDLQGYGTGATIKGFQIETPEPATGWMALVGLTAIATVGSRRRARR